MDLESGYTAPDPILRLKDLCHHVVSSPEFEAHDGLTFCSAAVHYITHELGCLAFGPSDNANRIVDIMRSNADEWEPLDAAGAIERAQRGKLVVAGKWALPHGHVVACYPMCGQFSGSWGHEVPLVAHVGKAPNGVKKTSEAFPVAEGEPEYFAWEGH